MLGAGVVAITVAIRRPITCPHAVSRASQLHKTNFSRTRQYTLMMAAET
jgi:hypothetical protein